MARVKIATSRGHIIFENDHSAHAQVPRKFAQPKRPTPRLHGGDSNEDARPDVWSPPDDLQDAESDSSESSDNSMTNRDGKYDVEGNEIIVGSYSKEQLDAWGHVGASFIRSPAGRPGQWIGVRPLGQGNYGIAGLWQKVDADGRAVKVNAVSTRAITSIH